MPIVTIEMFAGRTLDQKKHLVEAVTQAISQSLGVTPGDVTIILREMEKHNHAKGGVLTSERQ